MTRFIPYDTLWILDRKLVGKLDREEFRAKTEIINQLVYEKKYKEALELVDSIEWKKVKEAHALYTAGEVYEANKR